MSGKNHERYSSNNGRHDTIKNITLPHYRYQCQKKNIGSLSDIIINSRFTNNTIMTALYKGAFNLIVKQSLMPQCLRNASLQQWNEWFTHLTIKFILVANEA
jgi:hypothetical protein